MFFKRRTSYWASHSVDNGSGNIGISSTFLQRDTSCEKSGKRPVNLCGAKVFSFLVNHRPTCTGDFPGIVERNGIQPLWSKYATEQTALCSWPGIVPEIHPIDCTAELDRYETTFSNSGTFVETENSKTELLVFVVLSFWRVFNSTDEDDFARNWYVRKHPIPSGRLNNCCNTTSITYSWIWLISERSSVES